ncbi:tyrosinase cofactor [Streptomyces sp. NPDC059378]|uniref:tyrosinase cofactor n=1 Tax=Streptomyces sp. NPDC059378 TaxID=3346815 RepID=UPI00368A1D76
MVVSVGGAVVVSAEYGPESPGRPGPRARRGRAGTRRDLLRGLLAPAAALLFAPLVAASRPPRAAGGSGGAAFDETYRGRRIQGVRLSAGRRTAMPGAVAWQVTVDARPLHLMRRADGTWLSMVDHYRSYATPLEAARAAVDELGPGERLRAAAAPAHGPGERRETGQDHSGHMGGRHGLHT